MVKPCILTGVALAAGIVGSGAFTGAALARGHVRPFSTTSSRSTNSWAPRMAVTEEPKVSTSKVSGGGGEKKPEKKEPLAVVVNTENTQFSAGVLGGVAGYVVGGPFLAAILAITANFGSKQENEAGQAVRGVSAGAIEAFNFLTSLNSKYDVTGKAGEQLDKAMTDLKSGGGSRATIEKVESTLKGITSQASKLSSDYDLPAKAKQALGVAGELADTAIVKGLELGKEYKVGDKVKDSINKSKDSINKSIDSTKP